MAFQGQEQYSFEKLRRTIEKMILSRHTKTIGDEQCEEAIHDSVECIFEDCYSRHVKALDEAHLSNDQERPGQVYEKLLEQVFVWLKEYELNINEAKYLYLNRRIIDDIQARRQPLESVANVRICACQDNAKYLKLKREKKQFAVKVKLLKMAHDK